MGTGIGIVSSAVCGMQVKFVDSDIGIQRSSDFVKSWCDKEI